MHSSGNIRSCISFASCVFKCAPLLTNFHFSTSIFFFLNEAHVNIKHSNNTNRSKDIISRFIFNIRKGVIYVASPFRDMLMQSGNKCFQVSLCINMLQWVIKKSSKQFYHFVHNFHYAVWNVLNFIKVTFTIFCCIIFQMMS